MLRLWTQKTAFGGTARRQATGFSIGTKGYICAGWDGTTSSRELWEYNSLTDTWTQKASFGAGDADRRYGATGFSIGFKGYVGTGYQESPAGANNEFYEYDSSANTWTQKANFGGGNRYDAVGFSVGSKGYIGTGYDGTSYKDDFYEYDSSANTWTQKANFGGGTRSRAVGFSIGSKGYIGTGHDGTNPENDLWEYNPDDNTWAQKANFIGTARSRCIGFSAGTKGYIGTGRYSTTVYKDFYEYDSSANTWIQRTDFGGISREFAAGFSIGAKGYIGTGYDSSSVNKTDFWVYEQKLETPTNLAATVNSSLTQVDLSWIDNATEETNYVIERKREDEVEFSVLSTTSPDTSNYSDSTVNLLSYSYWYRVKCIKL